MWLVESSFLNRHGHALHTNPDPSQLTSSPAITAFVKLLMLESAHLMETGYLKKRMFRDPRPDINLRLLVTTLPP
jgi:hypothetical protein